MKRIEILTLAAILLASVTFAAPPQAPPISVPLPQAPAVVIPPCACGCMETGQCKCENCCKRTADPDWQAAHPTAKAATPKRLPSGWLTDYEAAFAESQATGKPLFVDVRTDSCVYCDLLDRELAQVDLSEFVACKLTASAYQAQQLGVDRFPTTIVIRDGQWGPRQVGFVKAPAIRSYLVGPPMPAAGAFSNGSCASGTCGKVGFFMRR